MKRRITLYIEWSKDLVEHQFGGKYDEFGMVGYIDSSYAGDFEDKKSITEYCFFLRGAIITWYSKR